MFTPDLLIAAAGVGSRMKIGYPKQYMPLLDGFKLLEITVMRLAGMKLFRSINVVVAPNDPYIGECRLPEGVRVLAVGGRTRAESVFNGLKAMALSRNDWVFVHDAARPCVKRVDIERMIRALESTDCSGAILASPVTDTLKTVDEHGLVTSTVDRRLCRRAQTPQGFRAGELLTALAPVLETATDEAGAMEAAGARVLVVESSACNIKVTHPDDALLAAFFLKNLASF
ncbi:MAG TPA: 2-C-methyl-D-erythritol 4-phosphate cytidylyltransferase [Candidatus Aphodousia gallistercoris]|nr:2-C-methyl-D-erythritol 4-phosphate cytidylyltransferase [Candidatus Aphodousia gallistercoris]